MPKKKTPQSCGCGCGGQTKGGRYLPGHDAKHKGILIKKAKARGPDSIQAGQELVDRGWKTQEWADATCGQQLEIKSIEDETPKAGQGEAIQVGPEDLPPVETNDEGRTNYQAGRCDVYTTDASGLAASPFAAWVRRSLKSVLPDSALKHLSKKKHVLFRTFFQF